MGTELGLNLKIIYSLKTIGLKTTVNKKIRDMSKPYAPVYTSLSSKEDALMDK